MAPALRPGYESINSEQSARELMGDANYEDLRRNHPAAFEKIQAKIDAGNLRREAGNALRDSEIASEGLQSIAREIATGAVTEEAVDRVTTDGSRPAVTYTVSGSDHFTLEYIRSRIDREKVADYLSVKSELMSRKFYIDGEAYNLIEALTVVLARRVRNLEDSVQDYLNEMQAQNRMAEIANDYLSKLRSYRPQEADGNADVTALLAYNTEFIIENGIDPKKEFGLEDFDWDPPLKQTEVDQMIEATRSKISSYNSTQDLAQLKLQRFNNNRNEAISLMSNLDKSFHDLTSTIIRNIQ